jgi:diguanylate cyclase (GGDEF)-like protein
MQTEARRSGGRGRGTALAGTARLLLMALVMFALPMVVTLQLKHAGERGIRAERDLQAIRTELQAQDGLEWRAISGRVRPAEVQPALAASRRRVTRLLTLAAGGRLHLHQVRDLAGLIDGYSRAVDQELRLLEAGQAQQATAFDETEVDPAFERAMEDLDEDAGEAVRRAGYARTASDGGLLLTVLLSVGLTTVVQGRRRRADVRRQAERRSEARYRALIDQSTDLVLVTDRAGSTSFLSPSAVRLLVAGDPDRPAGGAGDDAVDLLSAVDPADRDRLRAALQQAAPGIGATVEVRIAGAAGIRTFELSVADLTGQASVGGVLLTGHDVTDRLEVQRQVEHRALHDTLTGLPNRALLADRFAQSLHAGDRDGTNTGLLLIDLDRFKEINDTFGHHYGDALLTQVGPRLTAVLREVDTIARLGGDEFAVLLPGVADVEAVHGVALALQAALGAPFQVHGVDLDVEASIGVVMSGEHGTDPTLLLQRADVAMYVAKTQNLRVFTYDPTVDGHSPAKLALLGDLRRALHHDELVLHYQPKISLSTGDVVGAEALVRWQHPERGLLFPDAFIPLAEHTGLIGPLTSQVLSAALAQARAWADAGRPLTVSVNLSARSLLDDGLPGEVAGLLAAHGVPAGLLELEVTETAIMTEPARAQRLLEQLAALGVGLSLDDFGAGYTSLSQLKDLPFTELKIDKSFVLTMAADRSNAVIVSSVVDLGHNLGLTLVAEGVETAQVLETLTGYGCDVAQGYHLSRPIPAAAFDEWRATRATPAAVPVAADTSTTAPVLSLSCPA